DFRRLIGLEILSWFLLVAALPLGAIVGTAVSNTTVWADGFFAVLVFSLPIRFLTIASISSMPSWKKFSASALPPILSIISFSIIGLKSGLANVTGDLVIRGTTAFVVGIVLSAVGVSMILRDVERSGTPEVGDSPLTLVRAFLQHCLRSDLEPLDIRIGTMETRRSIVGLVSAFSCILAAW